MVRTILLSPEFRTTWGEKIKRPFEFAVSLLRAAEADFAPQDNFFWVYEWMGQPLFEWRPPNGYPDIKEDLLIVYRTTTWATTTAILEDQSVLDGGATSSVRSSTATNFPYVFRKCENAIMARSRFLQAGSSV